jgi:hypothetical protein
MILYRKVKGATPTDWLGDEWEVEATASRSAYITTDDLYYSVPNGFGAVAPIFFKLIYYGDERAFYVAMTKLDPNNFTTPEWKYIGIGVQQVSLGSVLSDINISSYMPLNAQAIITSSKISATWIVDTLVLGIAYDRGLLQWTIITTMDEKKRVITGYGHVGLDGSLTGALIPSVAVDGKGFKEPVKDMKLLPEDADTLPNGIYGTESTAWFVYPQVSGLVSHMTCNISTSGNPPSAATLTFVPQIIQLTNNTVVQYESSSFGRDKLFDILPKNVGMATIMGSMLGSVVSALSNILLPMDIMVLRPSYAKMLYVNHSLGQYAYVWRNSLGEKIDDKLTDMEAAFCKYKRTVSLSNGNMNVASDLLNVILKGVGTIVNPTAEYSANGSQNQSATDDSEGRKWSQFFTENVASTVASSLLSSGFSTSIKSTLVQQYTLDMFYAISGNMQSFAGPGFVQHNLVGQCVAQSVTDIQMEGKRIGYWVTLQQLTIAMLHLKLKLLELTKENALTLMESIGSSSAFGTSVTPNINVGMIWAIAGQVGNALNDALIASYDVAEKYVIPSLAGILGNVDRGESYYAGGITKRDLQLEGTHTYGDKPMTFFWPVFGAASGVKFTDESVATALGTEKQYVEFGGTTPSIDIGDIWAVDASTPGINNSTFMDKFKGDLTSVKIQCKGVQTTRTTPADMGAVEGITSFLSITPFKNEQIGVNKPVFPPPALHDFIVNKAFNISYTAVAGEVVSVTVDDTKVIDGLPSNIVINGEFCGIASSYIALEVRNVFDKRYLRPITITPTAVALNVNRINVVQEGKASRV